MQRDLKILYACLFVLMIGYGITLPVLPFDIQRLALSEGVRPGHVGVQVGVLTGLFALMQFFFAPLWGKLSDRAGRRIFLFIGMGGYAISLALFAVGWGLPVLYAARILGGILSAALLPVANAYVAETAPDTQRGHALAWLGASIGLGVVVGPLLGATLSHIHADFRIRFAYFQIDRFSVPFFTAAALALATLLLAIFLLPETISQRAAGPPSPQDFLRRAAPWSTLRKTLSGSLGRWMGLSFLSQFALSLFEGTFSLHAERVRLFGPAQMGVVFVTCGSVMAVVQAGFMARLMRYRGERPLLPIGSALMGVALILLMTTSTLYLILVYTALLALGMGILVPSLAVLVTKSSEHELGSALGVQSAAYSLGQALGPAIAGALLSVSLHLPYVLAGLLLLAAAGLFLRER